MRLRCKLCDSDDTEIILSPDTEKTENIKNTDFTPTASDFGLFYTLAGCKSCGALFSIIDEDSPSIRDFYDKSVDETYVRQSPERCIGYKRILAKLSALTPEASRLLDIGCSYGLFLKLAGDSGFLAEGVEPSQDACKYCKSGLNLKVFCGELNETLFSSGYFDAVTAIEVIEHLENPRDFISHVNNVLKQGGIFCVVTPDIKSIWGRLFGRPWWPYRRMHLCYFSRKTLSAFLTNNGFSVISAFPYRKTFRIDYMLDKFYDMGDDFIHKKIGRFFIALTKIMRIGNVRITVNLGDVGMIARKIKAC